MPAFFLHALSSRVRLGVALVAPRGTQYLCYALALSFASASQQRSLYTSYHVDATAHAVARQSGGIVNRDRASLVRSTVTARLWQRKGRCIRVKLACKMTRGPPRLHSPAFSRANDVNRDTRRPLGTRRNACGRRRDICVCLIKTGFDRSVGGAVWALTADPLSTRRAAASLSIARLRRSIAAAASRRNRDAPKPLLQRAASTVAALHARGDQREHCCRATRARGDHGQERKGE